MTRILTARQCLLGTLVCCNLNAAVITTGDTATNPLSAGTNGTSGTITINDGSMLSASFGGLIGQGLGGSGMVTVQEAGSSLALGGGPGSILAIGEDRGTGTMLVSEDGEVIVDAFASEEFSSGRARVGFGGNGTLTVDSGGQFTVRDVINLDESDKFEFDPVTNASLGAEGMIIGGTLDTNPGLGQLNADGSGTLLTVSGNGAFVNIGESASSFTGEQSAQGVVSITNGAVMRVEGNDWAASVGVGKGTGHGELMLSGENTRLEISGQQGSALWLGDDAFATQSGGSGKLFVSDQAHIEVSSLGGMGIFSVGSERVDGEAYFSDGGSIISDEIWVSLGEGGTSGFLSVTDTASVEANTIRVGSDGVLSGTGTVIGDVILTNGGQIMPGNSPGMLTIDGNLDARDGVLAFEFAGLTTFDQLMVLGDVDVTGTLIKLLFVDDFLPLEFDFFNLITASSITGLSQARFSVSGLAPGFDYSVTTTNGALSLTALSNGQPVSEPDILGLLVLMWGMVYYRQRRLSATSSPGHLTHA